MLCGNTNVLPSLKLISGNKWNEGHAIKCHSQLQKKKQKQYPCNKRTDKLTLLLSQKYVDTIKKKIKNKNKNIPQTQTSWGGCSFKSQFGHKGATCAV